MQYVNRTYRRSGRLWEERYRSCLTTGRPPICWLGPAISTVIIYAHGSSDWLHTGVLVGEIIGQILEAIKPETAYFTEHDGKRGGIFVVNVETPSDMPALSEPFYLNFNASCKYRVLMSPEDLQKAGMEELGKKWG